MLLLISPARDRIDALLARHGQGVYTYDGVGMTRSGGSPSGYVRDHNRALLGHGEPCFLAAVAALRRWEQFSLGWVRPCWPEAPLQRGTIVGVLARTLGLHSLHVSRVVYVLDEEDGLVRRFGFAYGTLAAHAESGEERFLIEWHRASDQVWYDLLAFSRPHAWQARVAGPLVRRWQRRFARDSLATMQNAVQGHCRRS